MEERIWHQHYDHSVLSEYRFPRIPVHHLVGIPANAFPDKAAISYFGKEITFWELRGKVIAMATVLDQMGVKKGDRVGIHLPNMPEYIITYYAALTLGAIVVNFNPLYTADELTALVRLTQVGTFVTFDMGVPVIKEVCKAVDIPRVIAASVFDSMGGEKSTPESMQLPEDWHHFSTLLENCKDPKVIRADIRQEDPALIQFTGGTTGIPKGAVLTHANIIAASYLATHWGSGTIQYAPIEKRNVLCALPFFHVYGNILSLNWSMVNCATMILVPRFEIDQIMDLIASLDKITFFPAVPTMINAVINHPKAKAMDLGKKINLLNSGGAPIPTEMIEQAQNIGFVISEGWGMSETTSMGAGNPSLGLKKVGSIGIPFPGMDVKLMDLETATTEVPLGEPGELVIKGPLVMKEYWNNPEKTAEELKDGWLYTGDIARMDEDGYLYIVDRKKDMIIAGGYNIYPRDVDEVLYQNPKIADAVTVGIKDEYRGETVKAFVVLKAGETATEKEIIDFCRQKLAAYKAPKMVEFRSALPTSAVGKILRKILRDEEAAKFEKK
ncbi:MAG: long-chain fatty acid--CoA ligase [Proteobacteria bacterium]|nr:long-chain fatty acid--CoA ligase [Pseudomonadota bacterium]MBU1388318.1 long-chain fatty acid--CoA ligase [Pseudomonadota bacterium]MBU1542864.1 long-chain fatty acid--CoA ligase [Pseudomonadota bacterium]MBU2431418.1 long-chain fatty acid--CoA ligase [Pseudomonadota bacterium]MBU2483070.1 long-chain fatty acid--CoA ligase [Pseudomonadota bacterium]